MLQPFHTQNRKLAEALAVAGCRWAAREDGGPTMNTYTSGFLRDRRLMSSNPVSLAIFEKAAKDAVERRIPGIVTYFFVRDDTFYRAEEAWQKTCIEMARAELAAEAPNLPDISPEVVAQVLCVYANSMKHLRDAPFVNPPWVSTLGGSTTTDPKNELSKTTTGQGKAWPLNATKEVREKIGV